MLRLPVVRYRIKTAAFEMVEIIFQFLALYYSTKTSTHLAIIHGVFLFVNTVTAPVLLGLRWFATAVAFDCLFDVCYMFFGLVGLINLYVPGT